jgi:hypothetical protein
VTRSRRKRLTVAAAVLAVGAAVGAGLWGSGVRDRGSEGAGGTEPGPGLANVWIDESGGRCRRSAEPATHEDAAACGSLSEAYDAAELGDTVRLTEGEYEGQSLAFEDLKGDPDAVLERIVFRPDRDVLGSVVFSGTIEVLAPHVELHRLTVPAETIIARYRSDDPAERAGNVQLVENDVGKIQMNSVWNFRLAGNDVGPREDSDGIDIYAYPPDDGHHPRNGIIEDNDVHDHSLSPGSSEHIDAIQLTAGEDIVIRRNKLRGYHHQGILAKTDQGPIVNLTIENNWIDAPVEPGFSLQLHQTSRELTGSVVRYNSFLRRPTSRPTDSEMGDGVMYGNLWPTMDSFTCQQWTDNAWELSYNASESDTPCGDHSYTLTSGDPYEDRDAFDLRLVDGADVRERGDPDRCPDDDLERTLRPLPAGTRCDAGAHERP